MPMTNSNASTVLSVNGSSAADGLWQKMKGIAATVGGMIGLKQALETSDQLTQTTPG